MGKIPARESLFVLRQKTAGTSKRRENLKNKIIALLMIAFICLASVPASFAFAAGAGDSVSVDAQTQVPVPAQVLETLTETIRQMLEGLTATGETTTAAQTVPLPQSLLQAIRTLLEQADTLKSHLNVQNPAAKADEMAGLLAMRAVTVITTVVLYITPRAILSATSKGLTPVAGTTPNDAGSWTLTPGPVAWVSNTSPATPV